MTTPSRSIVIDIARALAIILVVIGHFHPENSPQSYSIIHDVIYMFHMPLFLFISGYVYEAYSRKPRDFRSYTSYLGRKFKRLMIPYLSTSTIIILLKLASASSLQVDNPVTPIDLLTMFYLPSAGFFLWYIWALWLMLMIIPVFSTHRRHLLLLGISLITFCISDYAPDIFCIKQFCAYMIYFAAGATVAALPRNYNSGVWSAAAFMAIFALAATVRLNTNFHSTFTNRADNLITAFLGIAMAISSSAILARKCGRIFTGTMLSIASASYIIYLFHTTFEGLAKGVSTKVTILSGDFYMTALLVVLAGVVIPYVLYRYVLRRFAVTRFLFGL